DGISAGDTLTPPIIVRVVDSLGTVISTATDSITLSIASGPAGATLGGTRVLAAVTGIAPFANWRVQGPVGVYRFAVSAPGARPDTTAPIQVNAGRPAVLEVVSGDGQSAFTDETLPLPVRVRVRDAFTNPVPGVGLTFAVTAGGGSVTGATPTTDAAGVAGPASWRLGPTAGPQSLTASVTSTAGVTPLVLSATANPRPPAVVLGIQGTNVVGVSRVGTLVARLLQPAPAGGLVVSFANAQPTLLTIAAPSSVTIAAGDTLGTIAMTGVAEGTARVIATASGFIPDTLDVPVTLNLISLPTTLSVPLNQTQSLPVQLSTPAPAGGVRVVIASANPAVAQPVADTVTVPAGATLVNATMLGTGLGSTVVTASNANYASDSSTVTVTAAVDIVPTAVSLNASFGTSMTVRLASAGAPIPAPPGGTTISLTAVTPSCVTVPATVSIAAGNNNVSVPVTYGGTGAPCSSLIRASGPVGFATDSVTASVAATPAITVAATMAIGSGLQRQINLSLGATNHLGTTVRLTSLDSTKVLLAANTTTRGNGTVDVPFAAGANFDTFVVQATEGWLADTVLVVATAPGFVPDTMRVAVHLPIAELSGVNLTANTNSADDPIFVSLGSPPTPSATSISFSDAARAGGPGFAARIVNDTIAVGRFVQTAGLTDTAVVTIAAGSANSPTNVASGGAAFRPAAPGVAVLRAIVPGTRSNANTSRAVTVSQPIFSALSAAAIGAGLQRSASLTLGAPTPDSLFVTLRFDRPGVALLSPDATTPGTDSIVVALPPSGATRSFFVAGVDGVIADSVQLIATAPGYLTRQSTVRVFQPVFQLSSANPTATTLAADDPLWISIGSPSSPTGNFISTADDRRAGAPPFAGIITSDSVTVVRFVQTAGVTDTARVPIAAGQSNSPTTVATGGAATRYVGAGTTTLRAAVPGLRALTNSTVAVTVTQPSVSFLSAVTVGSGLQRSGTVTLSNANPDSAVRVVLRPDRTGVVLLAPNNTTVGADSLVLSIAAGATNGTFWVQALEGIVVDSVAITASAAGYTSRSATARVFQPLVGISGLNSSSNTFAADDPFVVFVATPISPTSNTSLSGDAIRAGGTPIVVTLTSATPSVGRFVTSTSSGATLPITIPVGANTSPNTVALGGIAFQTLTTGTTVVTATTPAARPIATGFSSPATVTITVVAPDLTLTSSSVGSGLQRPATATLSTATHGGTTVVLRSTNPSVLRLARLVTDIATDSIVVPVSNGTSNFSYLIVGMEGQTGTPSVEARAVGFTDGIAAMTVLPAAIQINSLAGTQVAGAADDPFTVSIGIADANQNALSSTQAVRAGSAGVVVTVTSSVPTAGVLVRDATASATATVTIPAGASVSPNTVADGIRFRPLSAAGSPTVVTAAAAGIISTLAAIVSVAITP
ncbi:MAG: hypothetical protein SFW08_06075, partial [Gemmatimonadaceae bacterium]|nr:hypothetical protein [Gemmatimonadaceae bacterium]